MTNDPTTSSTGHPLRWWILAVMLTAEIMDLLDSTIVNVAGPSLKRDLGASASSLQWIIGGYTLALGAGLILGGRMGDRYGRRVMFLWGISLFTAFSLLCAVSTSDRMLITARLLEGAAGAMLLPQGFGLIREAFPPDEFGKAFAVFGPVFGLGGILGPIIGGFLIQANLFNIGWRVVFLVNIPIGIAAVVAAWNILPRTSGNRGVTVDVLGSAIVAGSSALLILPLIEGRVDGWPLWTWLSLVASVVGFGLFVVRDRAVERGGKTPLVVASLFQKRQYTVGLAAIFLFFSGFTGIYLIVTLFLQLGEGFSAGRAAIANIAIALGTGIGGMLSGAFLAEKLGRRVLQIGGALQIAGAFLLWQSLGNITKFSVWHLVPGMAVSGLGTGLIVAALFDTILSSIGADETGSGSGLLSAVQSVGASAGVAVFGTVFFGKVALGNFAGGFRDALVVQVVVVVVFFVTTFGFAGSRPVENRWGDAELVA